MRTRRPVCHYSSLFWTVCLMLLPAVTASGQILTLTPSLAVGERYDDNIFQVPANKVDDFVTVISPGVQLRYTPAPETDLDFEYRADFEVFADNTEQNQVSQRAVLRFVSPLTRLVSANVRNTFVLTEEPRARIFEIDEVTGLRPVSEQSRQRTLRNRANASLNVQLAPRTTLGVLFASLIEDVSVPEEVDEQQYTVGADLGYLVTRRSRVSVSYDVTFHTFAENTPLAGPAPADFEVHAAKAGMRHDFSPTLVGEAAFGYAIVTSDDPVLDDDASIVANVGLIKTLRTGKAAFNYRRGFISGGGRGGSVMADTFTIAVSTDLTAKITAALSSNLSYFDFRQGSDRLFWVIRPSLVYQMLRFWSLSLAYDYAITDFARAGNADRTDQRVTFISRFVMRERLFLDLTYRYTSRQFDEVTPRDRAREFDRNEVMLTVTFVPTFLF